MAKCPGQDPKSVNPNDVFEVKCPSCGAELEFWGDEEERVCGSCRAKVPNPRKAADANE